MKPGDMVETAIWLSGSEQPQMIQAFKDTVRRNTDAAAKDRGVEVGPFEWKIKNPGDDRVPPVPDHIHGICVQLLVGEAKVLPGKPKPVIDKRSGFIYDLTLTDRKRLRQITARSFAKSQPGNRLNDKQCDAVIEYLGPDIIMRALRSGNLDT